MRRGLRIAVVVLATSTLFNAPLRADQIALTSGVIDLLVSPAGSSIGTFRLTGDRGFTFDGSWAGGFTQPVGNPLIPGATVTLQGSATGLDVGGTVTLDGVTYTGIGGLDSPAGAIVHFATTATLPSVLSPPAAVTAPFTLDFLFYPTSLQSHALVGSGNATIFLGEDKGFGVPSWQVTRVRAELSDTAPVPEPATFLLVGAGLGWAAVRRRQRRGVDGSRA